MRLYDNAYESNYAELKTFYPVWYWDVLEMDAIWRVLGRQLDKIQKENIQAVDNCFIRTADARTVEKLERFLHITYDGARDIEDRKMLIASFFTGNGHFGEPQIKDIVSAFTASPCSVNFANSTIDVRITRDINDTFILADCYFILLKKIPAHLALTITVISPFEIRLFYGVEVTEYKEEII